MLPDSEPLIYFMLVDGLSIRDRGGGGGGLVSEGGTSRVGRGAHLVRVIKGALKLDIDRSEERDAFLQRVVPIEIAIKREECVDKRLSTRAKHVSD